MAPRPTRPAGAVDVDDPAHPAPPRPDHPTTTQATQSSYRRFAASQPNECWQSDFTHWPLADGTDIEILSWLDDHSRYLLACTAYRRVTVGDVVASFTATATVYGLPASTLTDNGSVYTSRFTHGHNDFERLIASLGITQKNGHPGHPQTQGKIERFHRTLKLWLRQRRRPSTIAELQTLLDTFAQIYNTQRPHRAHPPAPHHKPPTTPYPRPPPAAATEHFRIRHDTVDQFGKLTLRHGSRLHHLGIGRHHAGTPVLILIATQHRHRHQQNRPPGPVQPRQRPRQELLAQPTENPGQRPGPSVTHDSTHM